MNKPLTKLEQTVMEQVDQRFASSIDFLQAMVHQPSILGNEKGVQDVVYQRLQEIGLKPESWDFDLETLRQHPNFGPLDLSYQGRPNVTAVWQAAVSGGKSAIFNGHTDVVSAEPLINWTHDPFGAEIVGEWMYGRGSADMKGGVAAMILAVEAVQAAGISLRGDVTLEVVIEEECTGNGTLACVLKGLKGDAAIVPESHGLTSSLATVGVIWFRVKTRGRASHALAAESAVNAIEKMIPMITSLRQLEAEMNAEPRHPYYKDLPHPINLNIGVIRSGDWPSTVPSTCTLECRLSCQPGSSVADTQERVRRAVKKATLGDTWLQENPPEVEFFGFRAEPSVVDTTSGAMLTLADCHQAVVGNPLAFYPSTATTDERFFLNNLGIPATCYGPIGERIHAGEERVFIPSILLSAKVMALFLLRWCQVIE
jgi:acetylornithine deacetylase